MTNQTENYKTILTFTHPHELVVIRAKLQSEGIECSIKDELITQVNPFYSNAVGGVKLQVKESDFQRAVEILKQSDYLPENEPDQKHVISIIDRQTCQIPFLNKLRFETRVIILVIVVAAVLSSVIYFATKPTTIERLTNRNWCLGNLVYKKENFVPHTTRLIKFKVNGEGFCDEKIVFFDNGKIALPGFNSHEITGKWKIVNDDLLQILQVDTFNFVYEGFYKIDFSKNELILKSDQTVLHCYAENGHLYLPF